MPLPQPDKQRAAIHGPLKYPRVSTDAGSNAPSHVRHILVFAGCGEAQHSTFVCCGRRALAPKTHDERCRTRPRASSQSGAARTQLLSDNRDRSDGRTVVLQITPGGSQLVACGWIGTLKAIEIAVDVPRPSAALKVSR